MKKHEIKTSKGEFVVVNIPTGCHVSDISIGAGLNDVAIGYPDATFEPIGIMPYRLICKLSEATEEDAKLIVDKSEAFQLYRNYLKIVEFGNKIEFTSAIDSLHSLLKSKGIDINNGNWYLFKKVK